MPTSAAGLHYADELSLLEARHQYFTTAGFGEETYSTDRWVRVDLGPLPIYFPNTRARKAIVPLHDLHHILNNYPTTFIGECQIGAWEIASGCRSSWIAWTLNMEVLVMGAVLNPKAVYLAYRRGKSMRNLYGQKYCSSLLTKKVGDLRQELGICPEANVEDTPGLRFEFGWIALMGFGVFTVAMTAYLSPVLIAIAVLWASQSP